VVPDLAGDDVAQHLPGLAVELHQLHLLDPEEVVAAVSILMPGSSTHSVLISLIRTKFGKPAQALQARAYSASRNGIVGERQLWLMHAGAIGCAIAQPRG
jgi:hypothetical protein